METVAQCGKISSSENTTFVATNEWQDIADGQGIPAGLHIRINLQTGKKEAKLLDKNDQTEDKSKLVCFNNTGTVVEKSSLTEIKHINSET